MCIEWSDAAKRKYQVISYLHVLYCIPRYSIYAVVFLQVETCNLLIRTVLISYEAQSIGKEYRTIYSILISIFNASYLFYLIGKEINGVT